MMGRYAMNDMTIEGRPPFADLNKTYAAQRKDRMGDCIGDYLTDDEVSPRQCYEEMLSEIQTWIDYHKKQLDRATALKSLMLGNREFDLDTYKEIPERF